ncbi:transcriptional regulator, LysR family protein [Stappia aggregata IAM 12614]|uniref:Transcriptional regulator, LysR family protein n=1 Tax=Roseibium aggregatum (strain ATCC 25650 / DSM 13394 / JCM 20685 / NBRC 16684 / NCIMB 2208 / IAM 12614 / B1) TaxID=384765 RepID=A0P105_ROSAI|nr:transcriptional regulator, LysR family protein [Stappia aggregata IAM 12614] [Roseibium aggregatum IAM 12614]
MVFTTRSVTIQKELARQGAAILILPEISVAREVRSGELVVRPLARDAAIDTLIQLSLPQGRTLSFAAEKLSAYLEARLRSYGETGVMM